MRIFGEHATPTRRSGQSTSGLTCSFLFWLGKNAALSRSPSIYAGNLSRIMRSQTGIQNEHATPVSTPMSGTFPAGGNLPIYLQFSSPMTTTLGNNRVLALECPKNPSCRFERRRSLKRPLRFRVLIPRIAGSGVHSGTEGSTHASCSHVPTLVPFRIKTVKSRTKCRARNPLWLGTERSCSSARYDSLRSQINEHHSYHVVT